MPIQDNFIPLTKSRNVDLTLKIAIQALRFEFDYSTRGYMVQFDPKLSADNLLCKRSKEDEEDLVRFGFNNAAIEMVPYISDENIDVVSFSIEENIVDNVLVLRLARDKAGFLFMREMIEARLGHIIETSPEELIEYIIKTMPKWYGQRKMSPSEWKGPSRLIFMIDRGFAEALTGFDKQLFLDDDHGNFVFDQREIS